MTRKVRFEGECDFYLVSFMNVNSLITVFLAPKDMTIAVSDADFKQLTDSGQIGLEALRDLGPI